MTDELGGMMLVGLIFLLAVLCLGSRLPGPLRWTLVGGLVMRVVGVVSMLAIIYTVYGGVADAVAYHRVGTGYAERMMAGDFRMLTARSEWAVGQWWGSQFMYFVSAPVVGILGPGYFGPFLFFSLLAFAGLCLFAAAFARTFPQVPLVNYARWLFFFPSLWLWPSVIGKEAVILFALGLIAHGFFRQRVAWLPTGAGLLLVFAIRPQVAAVVAFSMIVADWVGRHQRWTPQRVLQGAAIVALAGGLISVGLSLVAEQVGVEGAGEYLEVRAERAEAGRSAIEGTEVGITALPQGVVNTLFRPFPWEAGNVTALASSVEIGFLWAVALFRWRRIVAGIVAWRRTRMTAMGLPFVLIYAALFGMVIVNLGIIARQRIFLFPFIFVLLEAFPAPARKPRPGVGRVRARPRAGAHVPLPALPLRPEAR